MYVYNCSQIENNVPELLWQITHMKYTNDNAFIVLLNELSCPCFVYAKCPYADQHK